MRNKIFRLVASCVVICLVGATLNAYASQILTGGDISSKIRAKIDSVKPNSTFETQHMPTAPDYRSSAAWAALPNKKSNANFTPTNTKYPEAQATAVADVFFIHPTTGTSAKDNWNTPIDDPVAMQNVDDMLGFCASVFNAAAKIYAPRYRKASLYGFFDNKTTSGIKAIDLAYRDVEQAFLYYIKYYNNGRPFILAAHSQGSFHGLRLLQEQIIGTPIMDRLVAAYLIGVVIPTKIPGISSSRSATDTGVVIGWNTYTKKGDPSIFTKSFLRWTNGSYVKNNNKPLLEINPLSWQLNGGKIIASQNPGSLSIFPNKNGTFSLISAVCGADASGKVLIIDEPKVPGFSIAADNMPIFNAKYGDYHNFDYMLFYESIRKNVIDRVKAFTQRHSRDI